ncbi:hypothetical protein RB6880 [Rhodopirellula baltica SH 1]|uniref:Uncharacterized protein n=1 Tax=Rhodopirellula baltica (strain DSM 10527 / NCIMB 13988 / SH1) TaxID=243090 RepID=Q7UPK5_RHOBA|nr:hypothetical protein RB6880 [Rhodopirellula baltica SH 1]
MIGSRDRYGPSSQGVFVAVWGKPRQRQSVEVDSSPGFEMPTRVPPDKYPRRKLKLPSNPSGKSRSHLFKPGGFAYILALSKFTFRSAA